MGGETSYAGKIIEKIRNMIVKFKCPKCKLRLSAEDTMTGQTQPCPRCKTAVEIPTSVPMCLADKAKVKLKEFKFQCPQCNQKLLAEEETFGSDIQCPSCGAIMNVPSF